MGRTSFHGSATCAALFVGITAATADVAYPADPADTPEELRGPLTRVTWDASKIHPGWMQSKAQPAVDMRAFMPTRPVDDRAVPLAILVDDRIRRLDPRISGLGLRTAILTDVGEVDADVLAFFLATVAGEFGSETIAPTPLGDTVALTPTPPATPVPAPAGALMLVGLCAARRRRA